MSRTFTSRPGVSRQSSRGRGRGQSIVTRPLPINQPSVRGSTGVSQPSVRGVSTRRGPVQTSGQPSVRGSMLPAGGFGAGGARGRGRGDSRGRGMDPYRDPYGDEQYGQEMGAEGMPENTQQGQSLQQRATHTGAYTVISPNEKKRRQITEQAERGMRIYEEHKQQNTPTRVSYVGTVGGGEVLSMAEARQQQIKAQPTKTTRLIRERERRETQKQREERELEEKKNEARRKAELNEHKQKERQDSLKTNMHRVNQAFLNRLEAQGQAAAADHRSSTQPPLRPQPSVSARPKPTS